MSSSTVRGVVVRAISTSNARFVYPLSTLRSCGRTTNVKLSAAKRLRELSSYLRGRKSVKREMTTCEKDIDIRVKMNRMLLRTSCDVAEEHRKSARLRILDLEIAASGASAAIFSRGSPRRSCGDSGEKMKGHVDVIKTVLINY